MYYTLAWLDRYLAPARPPGLFSHPAPPNASPTARAALSRIVAAGALRRLTLTGTRPFDRSADVHSIGAGLFDPDRAARGGSTEGGNVPITIRGIPVRNLLSIQYDSRYFLDHGELSCDDIRGTSCPGRSHGGRR
jgi:hypothetical protein